MSQYESRDSYGHFQFDIAAFGRDLAAVMGLAAELEVGRYGSAKLIWPEGFHATLSFSFKSDKKVVIRGWCDDNNKIEWYGDRVSFPAISVNPSRDLSAIAKDIQRRLVGPAKEALEKVRAKVAEQNDKGNRLAAVVKEYTERFPGLSVTMYPGNSREASIYLNAHDNYLSGSVDSDGRLNIQRCSVGDATASRALLAALTGLTDGN
ncbi:hypothetical protein R5W60_06850 [Brucella pseudintermedia]|uniref:hypothetical protein n=1 Tax=Brucella pseudintermedia TaxID=370111 RepID=UPI00366C7959|nr:hypothetical protein R5W60_06850 [Brucella pseudintermedia]